MSGTKKFIERVHRVVVLPDFQGLGIGTRVLEFMGDYLKSQGSTMSIRTSHTNIIKKFTKSPLWRNSVVGNMHNTKYTIAHNRRHPEKDKLHKGMRDKVCYTFFYEGPKYIYPPLYILLDEYNDTQEYKDRIEKCILENNDKYYIYLTWGTMGKWHHNDNAYDLMKKYKLRHQFAISLQGTPCPYARDKKATIIDLR